MPSGNDWSRDWVTIEYEEETDVEGMEFVDELEALDFITRLRQLDDPQFRPVAILRHHRTMTESIERELLHDPVDEEAVLAEVTKRLLSMGRESVPKGMDALLWAVRATLEVTRGA